MQTPPKNWYKIGEVARQLDVAVETVRMYEREGLLIPEKTDSGQRIFNDADLHWIVCIRRLIKEKGLNLEGIRRMLALMPCWHLKPCGSSDFENCPLAFGGVKPCWMLKSQLPDVCKHAECRYCKVYQSASQCENLKKLFFQASLQKNDKRG
jgi:MerR family transcriptional regulator/heat shock protein HspR